MGTTRSSSSAVGRQRRNGSSCWTTCSNRVLLLFLLVVQSPPPPTTTRGSIMCDVCFLNSFQFFLDENVAVCVRISRPSNLLPFYSSNVMTRTRRLHYVYSILRKHEKKRKLKVLSTFTIHVSTIPSFSPSPCQRFYVSGLCINPFYMS